MSTVEEILDAASKLDVTDLARLRQELDRLEQDRWEDELARQSSEFERAGLSDEEIDEMVVRRRRESRP